MQIPVSRKNVINYLEQPSEDFYENVATYDDEFAEKFLDETGVDDNDILLALRRIRIRKKIKFFKVIFLGNSENYTRYAFFNAVPFFTQFYTLF